MKINKQDKDGITVEFLNAIKGHAVIFFRDIEPAERAMLAQQIKDLISKGHAVFLLQGEEVRMVKDYDAEKNEWLVVATPEDPPAEIVRYHRRLHGYRSQVTVVPPMAGG